MSNFSLVEKRIRAFVDSTFGAFSAADVTKKVLHGFPDGSPTWIRSKQKALNALRKLEKQGYIEETKEKEIFVKSKPKVAINIKEVKGKNQFKSS